MWEIKIQPQNSESCPQSPDQLHDGLVVGEDVEVTRCFRGAALMDAQDKDEDGQREDEDGSAHAEYRGEKHGACKVTVSLNKLNGRVGGGRGVGGRVG